MARVKSKKLGPVIQMKHEYNATRPFMHGRGA